MDVSNLITLHRDGRVLLLKGTLPSDTSMLHLHDALMVWSKSRPVRRVGVYAVLLTSSDRSEVMGPIVPYSGAFIVGGKEDTGP